MIKLITLATTAAVATLLTGCVVGPDAGYGYGQQTYYSDPGYAYGPSYAPCTARSMSGAAAAAATGIAAITAVTIATGDATATG